MKCQGRGRRALYCICFKSVKSLRAQSKVALNSVSSLPPSPTLFYPGFGGELICRFVNWLEL